VTLRQADLLDWDWGATRYDAVIGTNLQFLATAVRAGVFAGIARAVSPGGLALLHVYAPRQVGRGTGGPKAAETLDAPGSGAEASPAGRIWPCATATSSFPTVAAMSAVRS
jgi:hypothetical protein